MADVREYLITYTVNGTGETGEDMVWATDVEKAIRRLREKFRRGLRHGRSSPLHRGGHRLGGPGARRKLHGHARRGGHPVGGGGPKRPGRGGPAMSTVPFPPEMGYQPGMGPLHPARSGGARPQRSARSAQKRSQGQQEALQGDDQGKVPGGADEA